MSNPVIRVSAEEAKTFDHSNLERRRNRGKVWQGVFFFSLTVAIVALVILFASIIDDAFGYILIRNQVEPESIEWNGNGLNDLNKDELIDFLAEGYSAIPFPGYTERFYRSRMRALNRDKPFEERSRDELLEVVTEEVVRPTLVHTWDFIESVFTPTLLEDYWEERAWDPNRTYNEYSGGAGDSSFVTYNGKYYLAAVNQNDAHEPGAEEGYWREIAEPKLQFRSWVTPQFLISDANSNNPLAVGIRSALVGSIFVIAITVLFSFPVGVGAAVYLEEFAKNTRLNRFIQVNIYNLSGVPSIIYGLLGLGLFVRLLGPITSGNIFGLDGANGRTILSAGLTLGLLILPIIIIGTQEALRAIPKTLRDSAFGLGATRWQTVWYHVLPNSMDRILTSVIIAMSRAMGETAPLVVVGASTLVTVDPSGIFSNFTVLPMAIYNWAKDPRPEYKHTAAAAIVFLLILLLSLNATAITMRNRISNKRRMN